MLHDVSGPNVRDQFECVIDNGTLIDVNCTEYFCAHFAIEGLSHSKVVISIL